jgi:replication factor C subunit 1
LIKLDTQTKSTFTRLYNAASHPVPFMKASNMDVAVAAKKADKDMPDLEEALEEEDENDVAEPADVDDEEELDLKKDKYIKQPKAKGGKKATKKTAKAAGDDDDEDGGGSKPSKAKGKAAPKGRGRPKKA